MSTHTDNHRKNTAATDSRVPTFKKNKQKCPLTCADQTALKAAENICKTEHKLCFKIALVNKTHRLVLMFVFLALSQTPVYTARPRIRESASRGVPACVPDFVGTHYAHPRRDGQAELT